MRMNCASNDNTKEIGKSTTNHELHKNPEEPKTNSFQQESEDSNDNDSENEPPKKPINMSPGAVKLRGWLNHRMAIQMTDGRVLTGFFLCTDRDANVILSTCSEYVTEEGSDSTSAGNEEPRMLGLVMVPGKHIVSISVEKNLQTVLDVALRKDVSVNDVM